MRNRKYSDCCNKPAYHHDVFKGLWECSQCWKLCKVHNHIVDVSKPESNKQGPYADGVSAKEFFAGVKEARDKGWFKWLSSSVDYEEELARIFNRTDDKEELYKQVLELLKKL